MTKKEIGIFIKTFREENNISKYKLFNNENLSILQTSSIESGLTNYKINSLFLLCDSLGLTISVSHEPKKP